MSNEVAKSDKMLPWQQNQNLKLLIDQLEARKEDVARIVPLLQNELQLQGLDIASSVAASRAVAWEKHADSVELIQDELIEIASGKAKYLEDMRRDDPGKYIDRLTRAQARSVATLKDLEVWKSHLATQIIEPKTVKQVNIDARGAQITPQEGKSRLAKFMNADEGPAE